MAITYIGSDSGVQGAALPAGWAVGDLAVVCAMRDGSSTAPLLPAGWVGFSVSGANSLGERLGYRFLEAGDVDVGTWTNATSTIVSVYRGAHLTTPLGGTATNGAASGTTVNYAALSGGAGFDMLVTDGSSWVLAWGGHRNNNTTIEQPPGAMVLRHNVTDSQDELSAFDTNGGVAAWASTDVTISGTTSAAWRTRVVELLAAAEANANLATALAEARAFELTAGVSAVDAELELAPSQARAFAVGAHLSVEAVLDLAPAQARAQAITATKLNAAPTAPTISVTNIGFTSATITLTSPYFDIDGDAWFATQVRILRWTGTVQLGFPVHVASLAARNAPFTVTSTNLSQGRVYTAQARDQDALGKWSEWSASQVVFSTLSTAPPPAPILSHHDITGNSVRIHREPGDPTAAISDRIQLVVSGAMSMGSPRLYNSGDNPAEAIFVDKTIGGLKFGTPYYYRGREKYSYSALGAWSEVQTFTTLEHPEGGLDGLDLGNTALFRVFHRRASTWSIDQYGFIRNTGIPAGQMAHRVGSGGLEGTPNGQDWNGTVLGFLESGSASKVLVEANVGLLGAGAQSWAYTIYVSYGARAGVAAFVRGMRDPYEDGPEQGIYALIGPSGFMQHVYGGSPAFGSAEMLLVLAARYAGKFRVWTFALGRHSLTRYQHGDEHNLYRVRLNAERLATNQMRLRAGVDGMGQVGTYQIDQTITDAALVGWLNCGYAGPCRASSTSIISGINAGSWAQFNEVEILVAEVDPACVPPIPPDCPECPPNQLVVPISELWIEQPCVDCGQEQNAVISLAEAVVRAFAVTAGLGQVSALLETAGAAARAFAVEIEGAGMTGVLDTAFTEARGFAVSGATSGASAVLETAPAQARAHPLSATAESSAGLVVFSSYGSVGTEHEKILLALNLIGDGVTPTDENSWPFYDSNSVAKGNLLGSYMPDPSTLAVGGYPPFAGWDGDHWPNGPQYYDQALWQYARYYREGGNTTTRGYARKIADTWYKGAKIGEGTTLIENSHPPRETGLTGLMLRAIDGRPEMWDWIYQYVDYMYWLFIERYDHAAIGEIANAYREPGYVILFAAQLARVLPDSYPLVAGGWATDGALKRADLLARLERDVVAHFLPTQKPDGSWRWTSPDDNVWSVMPMIFMGLYIEGLTAIYFATSNSTIKASIVAALELFGEDVYTNVYRPDDEWRTGGGCTLSGLKFRSLWYFYHGGTTADHSAYENGGGSWPDETCIGSTPPETPTDNNTPRDERQIGKAWLVQLFGFLYHVTGDAVWKTRGDEWMSADFGNGVGPDADTHYNLCDAVTVTAANEFQYARNANQSYRSSGKYLGWRLMETL